ncbi:HD family phosphohydrolase [Spirochaetia bacterium]|nr:HD family phosphohydrolase [Spirochaetia bacterium]
MYYTRSEAIVKYPSIKYNWNMIIQMDALIQALAQALDMVEISYLGASTNHGKRIAVLCAAMGRHQGMEGPELSRLVTCALLHDNALTESILENQHHEISDLKPHCIIGQQNVEILPFKKDIGGYILYHHERADGQGPFKLSEGYYPEAAQFIAAADMLDVERQLQRVMPEMLPELRQSIVNDTHHRFTGLASGALLSVLDEDMLASLRDDRIAESVRLTVPAWTMNVDDPALICLAELIARIIDYKSNFTRIHTQQIANRAWVMAEYYGYSITEKTHFFLAAALHDLGKLAIPSEVLEKPGKLTDAEFEIIKTHIVHTRDLLKGLTGLENIVEWASNHHEKLDGSGYPLNKTADNLDFNSRLMAGIDIYQAVSEERPYHPRRSHEETMPILENMAERGGIDKKIVADLSRVMAPYSGKDVAAPVLTHLSIDKC